MPYNPEAALDPFRPTLLLTRPEPASARFAGDFRARFGAKWPILRAPLTGLRFLPAAPPPGDIRNVIVTSRSAVAALARLAPMRDLRAWCVAAGTAAEARAAGFEAVTGPGDAPGLARLLAKALPAGRVYYPRGADVAHDMTKMLSSAGIETIEAVVYAQEPIAPTAAARRLMAGSAPVLLPLFSPRAARLVAGAYALPRAPLRIAAMSASVAGAAAALAPDRLAIAGRPDPEAMLDALAELFAATDAP